MRSERSLAFAIMLLFAACSPFTSEPSDRAKPAPDGGSAGSSADAVPGDVVVPLRRRSERG